MTERSNDVIRWLEQFDSNTWIPARPGGRVRPPQLLEDWGRRAEEGERGPVPIAPLPAEGTGASAALVSLMPALPSGERMHERRLQTLVRRLRDFELLNARRSGIVVFVMRLWSEGHSIDNAIDIRVAQHRQPRALVSKELVAGLRELVPSFAHIPPVEWRSVWFEITERRGLG